MTKNLSQRRIIFAASLLIGVLAAAGMPWNSIATVGISTGILLVVLGVHLARSPQHLFLAVLGLVLAGYAFLGKGFAYLPAKPIFVGEITLGLGLFAALLGGKLRLALRSPVVWLLIAFAADGAVRTAPYISIYGLDAVRDATIWAYAAFAVLVAAVILQLRCFHAVLRYYGRWLTWLLFWLPIGCLLMALASDAMPVVSRSPVARIPELKPGDIAVQLAGAGCFVGLGLDKPLVPQASATSGLIHMLSWAAWFVAAAFAATQNRGGLLAMLVALLVSFILRPVGNWAKLAGIALIAMIVLFALGVSIPTTRGREFSLAQLQSNIESIANNQAATADLEDTRRWRVEWWDKIIGYTFGGQYFWKGKGFGINIAVSDGVVQSADDPLRSPHDATATILARMGVPGLGLWVLLQGSFGISLLRAHLRARTRGRDWWARVDLWILAFWLAFLINASFDVFLEGPQGGIWFWSLFGLGIAAMELQKQANRLPQAIGISEVWLSRNARRSAAPAITQQ